MQKLLENKTTFLEWIRKHIEINNLKENHDYIIKKSSINTLKKVNKERINYFLTYEAGAKIITSQSRNKKAGQIIKQLENGVELTEIIKTICTEDKIKIISFNSKDYPEQLRKIKNPPQSLYVKGNVQNLSEAGIAIIGTRYCTNNGRTITKMFANNLVGYKLNVISGLAIGIDGCAHKACIEAKGKTIAVLPSGFNNIYPKENEVLLNKILESGGTVITEYPPDFEKNSESCRARNRIISGLALATLVIEAGEHSGTSITARLTREQGKKVFCIPSNLSNKKGVGTNKMIKENKAKLVTEEEDIIKEFPELKLEKRIGFDFIKLGDKKKSKQKSQRAKQKFEITEENEEIYNFLTKEPKSIDEISQSLNKPISEVTYKLSLLELEGAIEELPGKRFKLK